MFAKAARPHRLSVATVLFPALTACALHAAEVAQKPAPLPSPRAYTHGHEPGDRTPDLALIDVDGARSTLHGLAGKLGLVLVTLDAECPVSQRYRPRLAELARRYAPRGFAFAILDLTPHSLREAKDTPRQSGVRTVRDDGGALAAALRIESTAEAFVIDRAGTLRYRGAIDDQYGISHQRSTASSHWLVAALDNLSTGEEPRVQRTRADGCPTSRTKATAPLRTPVTYHGRVSRIIQGNCQVCHRTGGLAPMPLETYEQVFARRQVIELMVSSGRMPPWSARPGVGDWANDRSLSPRDKADLLGWIKAGAPEGDSSHAPVARRFETGWNIGKPDAVIPIPQPFRVPAQGPIAYQYMYAKTDFSEDKWITAMEIRPTQPRVVHHVIAFLEEPGRKALTPEEWARLKPGDPIPPQPGDGALGFFGVTVPGSLGTRYPEGSGKKLPKGAWIRFEIHYQPNGAEVLDRTEIGFRFAPGPLREVESRSALNSHFAIPPFKARHEVRARYDFKEIGQLTALFPHMHLRGSAFRFDLRYPDGRVVALLDVPRFDFNWQSHYELRAPLDVPKGAALLATAWYDNSKANPWNPDPSKTVRWGTETYEEMMIGYFDFIPGSTR
jgi:hypothetical protein